MIPIRNGAPPAAVECDLCVYGFTPGGIAAAVAAARHGLRVILLGGYRETHLTLGGMMSNGLGRTDKNASQAIGGISREFFVRMWAYYGVEAESSWDFEPHVAGLIFRQMLAEAGVQVVPSRGVVSRAMEGRRLLRVATRDGLCVSARAWICASYEGDLLRLAGATLVVGREGNAQYGETYNGVIPSELSHNWGGWNIDPFFREGDSSSGLLPTIECYEADLGTTGSADRRAQEFNFRLCMTQRSDRVLLTAPPAGFDASQYEPLVRLLVARRAAGRNDGAQHVFNIEPLPNGAYDWNARGPFSSDFDSAGYVGAEGYEARLLEWARLRDRTLGLLWLLWGHRDNRIPSALRDSMRSWGFDPRQFTDPSPWGDPAHFPRQLYVRQYARLRGPVVVTQHDVERADDEPVRYAAEVVGAASYFMDSHNTRRYAQLGPAGWRIQAEGGFFHSVGGANQMTPIPYGALIPRAWDVANVATTWSLSTTHPAYGLMRMEPSHMVCGHAAGDAAVMLVQQGLASYETIRDEPAAIADLRAMLRAEGAAIDYV